MWFGLGENLEIDLFGYGYIIRYNEEDCKYEVWYRDSSYNPDIYNHGSFDLNK